MRTVLPPSTRPARTPIDQTLRGTLSRMLAAFERDAVTAQRGEHLKRGRSPRTFRYQPSTFQRETRWMLASGSAEAVAALIHAPELVRYREIAEACALAGPFVIELRTPDGAHALPASRWAALTVYEMLDFVWATIEASYARSPEYGLVSIEDHEAFDLIGDAGAGRVGPLPDGTEIEVAPTVAEALIAEMVARGDALGIIPIVGLVTAFNAPPLEQPGGAA